MTEFLFDAIRAKLPAQHGLGLLVGQDGRGGFKRGFLEKARSLFVGGLSGLQLHRVIFKEGRVWGRELLLTQLRLRVRDVRQGPDGLLYLAIDANPNGAILRIEPATAATSRTQR